MSSQRPHKSSLHHVDDFLPKRLPEIQLRHGQVLWLLTELGYGGFTSKSAFFEYIKSLRKLGIPFGHKRFQTRRSKNLARYSYWHLMEFATVLSLRVYHVIPDAVLNGIVSHRRQLYRLYGRAYMERRSGAGKPTLITVKGCQSIELRGLFLDLNIQFAAGHLVSFGRPKLLSATETLVQFSKSADLGRAFLPLALSLLSERVTALALRAPEVRSGPPKTSMSMN